MKPQDSLEQFIQTHREAFDDHLPPPNLWPGIQAQLTPPGRRRQRMIRLLQTSAAAVFLLLVGTAIGYRLIPPSPPISADAQTELLETEQYYQLRIEKKLALLTTHSTDATVLHDLQYVDNAIEELKHSLQSAPVSRQPQIMAELIQSYQTKIDILELVLSRTRPSDTSRKNFDHHETSL